jgi:hypothetical protein
VTYGAFVQASSGTFTFSLSWTAINQASTIEFMSNQSRTFRALAPAKA